MIKASTLDRYVEALEDRIVELLLEFEDDEERRAMMRELGDAAWESGVDIPSPEPENLNLWVNNLVSENLSMRSVIQNELAFGWMPHPSRFENLDAIVSAFRPTSSLD